MDGDVGRIYGALMESLPSVGDPYTDKFTVEMLAPRVLAAIRAAARVGFFWPHGLNTQQDALGQKEALDAALAALRGEK